MDSMCISLSRLFLLIFLLLFGIEIGEPQEKRRHDDNT